MKLQCDRKVCVFLLLVIILTLSVCVFIHHHKNVKSGYLKTADYSDPCFHEPVQNEPQLEYLSLNKHIDWNEGFRDCGYPMEGCDVKTDHPDYMVSPKYCRCDRLCLKYGDCCVTALKKFKKIRKDNPWRCVRLPNSDHAVRMISKCPSEYPEELDNKQLCEQPKCQDLEEKSMCPWLDVPVLHNATRDLYRNIYCARCHGFGNSDLYRVRQRKSCTKPLNGTHWETFVNKGVYQTGELEWHDSVDRDFKCYVQILELQRSVIMHFVPNVRFCPGFVQETCDLDLKVEANVLVFNLCHAYMQVVNVLALNRIVSFKNPHCAKCLSREINVKRVGHCDRLPARQTRGECENVETQHDVFSSAARSTGAVFLSFSWLYVNYINPYSILV